MDKISREILSMDKDKKIVGIDIGSFDIKFAVIEVWPAKVALAKTVSTEFPLELTETDKPQFILETVKDFFHKENLFTDEVYLLCPNSMLEVKRIQLPSIPAREIPDALKWQLADKLPFSLDNAVLNFEVTDEIAGEDGSKSLVVMAACADKTKLHEAISFIKPLNLISVGMFAASLGLENILNASDQIPADKETVAVVEFGNNHTNISIFKNKRLVGVRKLRISSELIQNAMCSVFMSDDKGKVELTPLDARTIKQVYGIPQEDGKIAQFDIPAYQILSLIRPMLEELALEIKRTDDYYVSQLGGKPIEGIYLAGGGSLLKNLDSFLAKELSLSVEYLKLPSTIMTNYTQNQDITPFICLIGAMLEGPSAKVNLLPVEMRVQKAHIIQKISVRLFMIAAISTIIIAHFLMTVKIANHKSRLGAVEGHYKAIAPVAAVYERVMEMGQLIQAARQSSTYAVILLKEISNVVPANITLKELNIDIDKKLIAFKGILDFAGFSGDTQEVLSKFIEGLERSQFFKESRLVSWGRVNIEDKWVSNFEVTCQFQ